MTCRRLWIGPQPKAIAFKLGPPQEPLLVLEHGRGIAIHKSQLIKGGVQREALEVITQLSSLGLLKDQPRVRRALQGNKRAREVNVGDERVGGKTQSLAAGLLCLLKLPQRQVLPNQSTVGVGTSRITANDLPVRLRCLVQFPGDTRVVLC